MRPRSSAVIVPLAALLLVIVCCSSGAFAQQSATCYNELDDSFLNKCRYQDPGFFTIMASYIMQFINPRTLVIIVMAMILVLPVLMLVPAHSGTGPSGAPLNTFGRLEATLEQYRVTRWKLLHFLHRLCFPLVLAVALYGAFRQSRPCRCIIGGELQHIGSIYGMPSGDAMSAAMFAAYLFEAAPYSKWGSRITAVLVLALVCMERAVLGYHSIAQVTVGSCVGILLHIYSTRAPQWMVFVDGVVSLILGCVLLQVDPAMVYPKGSANNLFAWLWWGISIEAFACILLARHYWTSGARSLSRNMLDVYKADAEYGMLLNPLDAQTTTTSDPTDKQTFRRLSDAWWTLLAFGVFTAINIFSWCIGQWNILTKSAN